MTDAVTVFVKTGDPASESILRYLDGRGQAYTKRDVLTDPSATAILFGRLGRVTTPVVQIGDRLLVRGLDRLLSPLFAAPTGPKRGPRWLLNKLTRPQQ